ncbi:MAG: glycoside hydrolase family 97 N-terminal domain-containing protein [Pirellulales bacterium]|nr:glycoside hydrolase family 97 N-terminal domain-containing protein [Pirellulales bacterium]
MCIANADSANRPHSPLAAITLACLCAMILVPSRTAASAAELKSPDGQTVVAFYLADDGGLFYRVAYRGRPILVDSRLGLDLKDSPPMDRAFRIVELAESSRDETWRPVYGERSEIRDHYNQLVIDLEDRQSPPRRLQLTFRAYDEGAAWCYTLPEQEGLKDFVVAAEKTEFRFADNHVAWPVYSAQGVYERARLDDIKPNCERPLTVQLDGGPAVAVGEARLVDYARMRLRPAEGRPHALQSMLASEVKASAPYTTPWRYVMIAESPGGLIEKNYLLLNLNDPCAIADTSWIKPGKVIREVTLTTAGGKACVDFAVQRGLQYIEYDAGWYGPESQGNADATTVTRDTQKAGAQGNLDLHEVIRYAEQRGIGVLVYVNRRALERQLDEILPLYRQWGIKGVKYGFVQVGSEQWTTWLHEAVRKAAEHRLMVDIHDEYRPTGFSRTYPNLMTQEGIRGNECMPPAEHNLILPFTRGLCGAGDYTVCWYCDRIKTTRAHQLAAALVFYSPLQFLFWYDRPQQYRGEPELEFFKQVPTVWDETRVVHGEIGRYITIARRTGDRWFVGTLNAVRRRKLEIPLVFLEPGKVYTAEIHGDESPEGNAPTKVHTRRVAVDSTTVFSADMAANGGEAIRIVPR